MRTSRSTAFFAGCHRERALHRSSDGALQGDRQLKRLVDARTGAEQVARNANKANVNRRSTVRLVREGDFAADIAVSLIETEGGWERYLSLEDCYRLDDVRDALRAGDVRRASMVADRVYRLTPVQA